MNVVYLGTPDFAVKPLIKLIESKKVNVVAVITNKDKPVGRKAIITPPPVKVVANSYNIPVFQYDKIRVEGVEDLKNISPDLIITCAFGQILSQEILDISKFGVINIHASLLPKYRGASPIHYAILNGEKETGVSIMKTDVGIDTGDVMIKKSLKINNDETCGQLFERLSELGSEMILEAVDLIELGKAEFSKQDDALATYTKIIKKSDAKIDWNNTAENIFNQIRAFNPQPVAFCDLFGEPFKIYQAQVVMDKNGKAGEILKADDELIIACGKGSLSLKTVQKAGGKALPIKEFLRGNKLVKGEILR